VGFAIGVALGAASWAGNVDRTNLGLVSAFPDLLTVAAVPLAMYFVIRARLRSGVTDRVALRKTGWAVVNTAAIVFAVFLACVDAFWFNQLDAQLTGTLVVEAIVVTVGAGYLSVEVWTRLLQGAHR
jgi:hypothetical protein